MSEFEDAVSQKMDGKVITLENIMIYVKCAMELAELRDLEGPEQKQLVIHTIRKLVRESNLSSENEMVCLDFIDSGTLSQTIDIIIDATKGRLNINKPEPLIKRILQCCLPFLNRTATNV
jgi:hypothetical protein